MNKKRILGLLLFLALPVLSWELAPAFSISLVHLLTGAPTRIPRSISRVKWSEYTAAWTPAEIESLSRETVSRGAAIRPLFTPDLSGYDLPHRLNLRPTDMVADIGCGTGALEIGLVEQKIPFNHLYAIDIDATSLRALDGILSSFPDNRIEPLLVEPGSLGVPDNSIDVMVVDTVQLHQPFNEPDPWALHPGGSDPEVLAMLRTLKTALKPGGRLHVIENLPANIVPEPTSDAVRLPYEEAGFNFLTVERLRDAPTNSGAWYLVFERR